MIERVQAARNTQDIENEKGQERLLQAYEIYNNLAAGKLGDFREVKGYLTQTLEELLETGKIGRGVVVLSRIKSPESVVKNWKLGKNLNDILGITLYTENQQEIEAIRAKIREDKKFEISSRKQISEKRGYEAVHFTFNVGEGKQKTKVECHLQTHLSYENVYPHVFYKVRRELARDLKPEEEKLISEKIQEMYQTGELAGYSLSGGRKSRIPQMWVASFDDKGKMHEQELEEKLILTIMYPFVDFSRNTSESQNLQKFKDQIQFEDEVEIE